MIAVRTRVAATFAFLASIAAVSAQTQVPPSPPPQPPIVPWMNTALSPDARADYLVEEMTEDERLTLVMGYLGTNINPGYTRSPPAWIKPYLPGTAGYIPGIARLGIPAQIETDAGVGVANNAHMRPGDSATALPATLATAATFDPDMAFSSGAVIAVEARARGYNVVLDGSLNLGREPRGGRTFEYAGEDPLLAGTIAGEVIRGVQSRHVMSTVKHFALNDQETGRGILSANIEEGPMRESDLLAFEIAIEHGSPGAAMCAYNRVNSTFSCENGFLLNHVLKDDWHYPGFVLSDWGGVHSTIEAARSGLDQESARDFDGQDFFGPPLKTAIEQGSVTRSRLRDMAHRILRSMFANGLFDDPPVKGPPPVADDIAIATKDAEEGIVLLKNDGAILPLTKTAKTIAIIGGHADLGMMSGGGSSQVIPIGDAKGETEVAATPAENRGVNWLGKVVYDPPSPLSAIKAAAPSAIVRYDDGADLNAAADRARNSDVAIVFAKMWRAEGQDVVSLSLEPGDDALIEAVAAANPHTIVVLETGGPVLMPWLDKVQGVVEAWYAGNGGAVALTHILFGDVNPSGHLPITFPVSEAQLPNPVLPGHDWHGGPFDVEYPEGADVGYRWFEKQKAAPLFPFGFGLSYTHFTLTNFAARGDGIVVGDVDVTNDGKVAGREVVQLYATPPDGVSRLVGFASVMLQPGETKHLTIPAEGRLLAYFDVDAQKWNVAAGNYQVAAGTSSADLGPAVTVALTEKEMDP
jgi:beta-glucosidase